MCPDTNVQRHIVIGLQTSLSVCLTYICVQSACILSIQCKEFLVRMHFTWVQFPSDTIIIDQIMILTL